MFARPKSPLRWRRRAARYLDDGGQLSSGEYGKLKAISKIKKEFHVNTIYFTEPTTENIAAAADIIRRGGLLGIPTETVYGLGANALDEEAVLHIFEAKGRPQDNPLILHIPDASWLTRYCEDVPDAAYKLAERFWPGHEEKAREAIAPAFDHTFVMVLDIETMTGKEAVELARRRRAGEL